VTRLNVQSTSSTCLKLGVCLQLPTLGQNPDSGGFWHHIPGCCDGFISESVKQRLKTFNENIKHSVHGPGSPIYTFVSMGCMTSRLVTQNGPVYILKWQVGRECTSDSSSCHSHI